MDNQGAKALAEIPRVLIAASTLTYVCIGPDIFFQYPRWAMHCIEHVVHARHIEYGAPVYWWLNTYFQVQYVLSKAIYQTWRYLLKVLKTIILGNILYSQYVLHRDPQTYWSEQYALTRTSSRCIEPQYVLLWTWTNVLLARYILLDSAKLYWLIDTYCSHRHEICWYGKMYCSFKGV